MKEMKDYFPAEVWKTFKTKSLKEQVNLCKKYAPGLILEILEANKKKSVAESYGKQKFLDELGIKESKEDYEDDFLKDMKK